MRNRKIILAIAGFLFVLNIFCWHEVFAIADNQDLKVEFFDVGQGDSAFVRTPENYQILIDGGPSSAVLSKLSQNMPFWDRALDLVILSHPESDHMQGLLEVLKRYKADYILWTGVKKTAPEYDAWLSVLEKQKKMGAQIIIASANQKITAGNLEIDTLYPLKSLEGQELKASANYTCVVSKLIYGNTDFLFTGDISFDAEKELVGNGTSLVSDVLKIAHHGSKYSTSEGFLGAVSPEIAVISVGKDNTYGHPTPEVLSRLDNMGVQTLRTDQNGDITILSNGNKIYLK
jgi:competence protein ComEC